MDQQHSQQHDSPTQLSSMGPESAGASMAPPAFSLAASPVQPKMDGCKECGAMQLKAMTSFPEGAEKEEMSSGGAGGGGAKQLKAKGGAPMQLRGGTTVGTLCIKSNAVNDGLTAGHAWLSYTPTSGGETTYGTWGNVNPIGLHRDREVGRPAKASRCTEIDSTDKAALDSFAAGNNSWSYTNNCSSFAARGWLSVTGESLSYTSMGIPNPSALGSGIVAAGGTLAADQGGGSSASSGSSYGSSSLNSSKPGSSASSGS